MSGELKQSWHEKDAELTQEKIELEKRVRLLTLELKQAKNALSFHNKIIEIHYGFDGKTI